MLVTTHTDVLVVGLGPAGSSAAREAAVNGCKVVAVESRKRIGLPVQCAEFISLPTASYASGLGAAGVRSQFVQHMLSELPSGRRVSNDFRGCIIHRDRLDQHLARLADSAGVETRPATRLIALDLAGSTAVVRHEDRECSIRFRYLIAADGPRSSVARKLGLACLPVVKCHQYTVPLLEHGLSTDVWLGSRFPGGYGWLFPKEKLAHVGIGLDEGLSTEPKVVLDSLHRELVLSGRVGERVLSRTGGLIPVGGMRQEVLHQNVVFAGDAAGLTHPITGAGIAAAITSGEYAGQAVARHLRGCSTALEDYSENIQDEFGPGLTRAVTRRRELLNRIRKGQGDHDATLRRAWIAFDEYYAARTKIKNSHHGEHGEF